MRQLSAGGAIVHPAVPSMLFTPICPYTLSFRPLALPDSVEVKIVNPRGSRNSAWVRSSPCVSTLALAGGPRGTDTATAPTAGRVLQASFDGRNRIEIPQGSAIRIRASEWAVPTVCLTDATGDWYARLLAVLGSAVALELTLTCARGTIRAARQRRTRFNSLSRCLNWNARDPQKSLDDVRAC